MNRKRQIIASTKFLFAGLLWVLAKPVFAGPITIHPANRHITEQTRGSSTAMCWIDYNEYGVFTSHPWCQVHLPAPSGPHTREPQLVVGGSSYIEGRISGQPGTAVCTVNFNAQNVLVTIPLCYRGLSGGG
ncbi:hypothetical protein Lepto7375DRAFT_7241 [Leptolyngbya sp. PCC 7375]|nr:hypothetical protein Lepto7375DRAFT_7241 [Leptolyngbya sp. PCC 7375]